MKKLRSPELLALTGVIIYAIAFLLPLDRSNAIDVYRTKVGFGLAALLFGIGVFQMLTRPEGRS